MADEQGTETKTEEKTEQKLPAAQLSPEAIAEIRKSILDEVLPKAQEKAEQLAGKKVQDAITSQNQRVLQAMGLGKEDHSETVLNKFLEDPMEVLTMVGHRAKEAAKEELKADLAAEKAADQRFNRAVKEVMSDRLDIRSNDEALEIVQQFYEAAPDTLTEKERMDAAVKKYDNLMEKGGAGKPEVRIQAAKSSASSKASGQSSDAPTTSIKDREAALIAKERDEKIERYKKTHGGMTPESMRS